MLDWLLTNGDITFSVNDDGVADIDMVTGAERVRQSILIQLNLFLGEWFDDLDAGVPWFQGILAEAENYSDGGQRRVSEQTVEAILRSKILEVEGVDSIITYSQDLNKTTRSLSIEFSVMSDEGVVAVSSVWPL